MALPSFGSEGPLSSEVYRHRKRPFYYYDVIRHFHATQI
jgi:hypothetical protein